MSAQKPRKGLDWLDGVYLALTLTGAALAVFLGVLGANQLV